MASRWRSLFSKKGLAVTALGCLGAGALGVGIVHADTTLHPPKYPWAHKGLFDSLDHASLRRGYQVYKEVCSACHSMEYIHYRQLVGVTHTEEEAKAEAAEMQVDDGPDDEGNMFTRAGKLSDPFPKPYANDNAARAANNGALPPDLTLVTLARHGQEDYIFSILTGYEDPPEGIILADEQYYNPYFNGGSISMKQALYNEIIEFEDGTPATMSQCAKDVCAFLRWTAEPSHDQRKKMAIKVIMVFSVAIAVAYYFKKHKWAVLKSRKIIYTPRNKKL